ncbi:MAG TPA: tetratricopeptide repeat protein [Myxococcales bacterium]|nr:tetratricopeptide repeat protein [Myxococcales bacterium]
MTSRGFFPRARLLFCAAALMVAPAFAQEAAAPALAAAAAGPSASDAASAIPMPALPAPVAPAAAPAAAAAPPPALPAASPAMAAGNYAVTLPAEKSADIQAHWAARREYVRDRDERRADDEEQRVRALKDELAIENLFSIGAALVRESIDARAADAPAVAVQRCKLAVEFAPALPEAHTCLARALLAEDPAALTPALAQLVAAAGAAMRDPRISRSTLANALGVLCAGLLVAGLAFVALLFLRHARLYAHDVHHLFPGRPRRWQTAMLAAVLLLLPILFMMGPVPLLFTALLACGLYLSTAELAVSVALLVAVAVAPLAAGAVGKVAAYGGAAVDVWLVEHGEGTGPEIARLERQPEGPGDLPVSFALARKAKRDGDLAAAERLYLKALAAQGGTPAGQAALRNDLGNVYLLEGETANAVAQYRQAVEIQESLAAPHFNLARALAMSGVEGLEKAQAEQARAVELDRAAVDGFTGGSLQANRKSNKFVMDVPLDDAQLAPLREAEAQAATQVQDQVRALLAGGSPSGFAAALPLLAAALLLALHLGRGRLQPSGRCDRCGRAVCKRCDAEARPAEALCAQCVNVFIRRTGVDAAVRVRKEFAVKAYQRRRRLLSRLLALISGAGHVLLGYPLRGMFFLLVTGSLAASIALWSGLARYPIAVRSGISFVRVGVSAALFIAIYAFCLRDLMARQRAEEGV